MPHLDQLLTFLDREEAYPILCGYFQKVVSSLLSKQKSKFLSYVLLNKDGAIFDKLCDRLEHHSLAQLLIELIEVQLVQKPGDKDKFQMDWDKDENQ